MNWLIKWGVKKWLLSAVNTALTDNKDNIDKARSVFLRLIGKAELIIAFAKSVASKLEDHKLDDCEVEAVEIDAITLANALCAKEV